MLVHEAECSVAVFYAGDGQELLAVQDVCACLGCDKEAEYSPPWLSLSIPALAAAKESSHCAACARRELVSLFSWAPCSNRTAVHPQALGEIRRHANCGCVKDCIWCLGTYPTGNCILVVPDLHRLFWHCLWKVLL